MANAILPTGSVRQKAMGQAMMKDFGQLASHSGVGPRAMNPMIPDMEKAIISVMRAWAIKREYLLGMSISQWRVENGRSKIHHWHHPNQGLAPWVRTLRQSRDCGCRNNQTGRDLFDGAGLCQRRKKGKGKDGARWRF